MNMNEIENKHQVLVGSSRPQGEKGVENVLTKEVSLTPEQRAAVSVLQDENAKLSNSLRNARDNAGKQLQKLHGKELAKAGMKQIGFGLFGDLVSALGSSIAKGKIFDIFLNKDTAVVQRYSREAEAFEKQIDQIYTAAGQKDDEPLSKFLGYAVNRDNFRNATEEFDVLQKEKRAQMRRTVDDQRKELKERQPILENRASLISKAVSVELSGLGYMLYQKGKDLPPLTWYDWAIGQAGIIPLHIKGADLLNLNPLNPPLASGIKNVVIGLYQMVRRK